MNIGPESYILDDICLKLCQKEIKVYFARIDKKIDLNYLSFDRNTYFKSEELLKMNISCLKMLDKNLLIANAIR